MTESKDSKRILLLARYAFPYDQWVKAGHSVVLMTDELNKAFFAGSKAFEVFTFAHYESSGLVEHTALALHAKRKFTHVVYQAEQDIIRAARLRAAMGLSGQSLESATCFRDKVVMKDRVKAKCAVPAYCRVESALDVVSFVAKHGLPIVVKPSRGMGSTNTSIVRTQQQLEQLLAAGFSQSVDGPVDLMCESFVQGQMHHIDGCVHEGKLQISWPSSYINDCVDFASSKFLASFSLQADNPLVARLNKFIQDALSTLECPASFTFHGEAWHTPADDGLVFCEVACRAGGAGVVPTLLHLFEVDINKFTVQTQCGDAPTSPLENGSRPPKGCAGWMLMYPEPGCRLERIPAVCELPGVISYNATAAVGREYAKIAHCTEEVSSFGFEGSNEQDMRARIESAAAWFTKTVRWAKLGEAAGATSTAAGAAGAAAASKTDSSSAQEKKS